MANIKLGYGIGIKATLLTPAGAVCDLRDALYVNAVLTLPNGSTMYAQDIAVDRVTNAIYVRLLADRELTAEGNYRILFNVKLADGVMYSTVAVNFANVTTDADAEYKELSLSFSLEVTDYPQNVERTGASPKVSTRQTWLVYNDEAKAYEDTGIPAEVNFSDYYTKEETDAKVVELVRLEIGSINRVNTTSSINYVYNMEDYNVGDTFLVEIEQADNVNPEVQILDSESSIIGGFDLFENRYVFSKNTDSLKQIRIRAFRIDTELPSTFVAKFYKVNNIPMGYISDTSYTQVNNDIIVRPNINGYYDTDNLTLSYQWVTTPIIKSRGFSFDIDANFETYVLQVNRFYNNFKSVAKVTLTSKTNIDFTQCYGWTIQFRRNDRQNIAPSDEILTDVNIQISNIQGEVFEKPLTKSEVETVIEETAKEIRTEVETVKNDFFNPFKTTPFYAHYAANGFIKDGQGRKAIASESLEDIAMMARLGYTIIEANIHKNASGDFIVIHGDTSNNPVTFGDEVIDISNDTLGSNIAISETTTEYMKANIRYNSEIEKYRTSVPTLEEFCQCCKENNIGIFAGTADRDAIAICRRYLENNIVLYNPGATIRENYKGWVFVWNNSNTATIDSLLEQADKYTTLIVNDILEECVCDVMKYISHKRLEREKINNLINENV